MYDRLNKYIVQNNLLHPLQHGFQTGHSTVMALMNLQDKIIEATDKNEFPLNVSLSLAKAYDTSSVPTEEQRERVAQGGTSKGISIWADEKEKKTRRKN